MASKIKVDSIETTSGSGTIALSNQLSGMTSASVPAGSVLQVVHGHTTTGLTLTATTFVDSGLSASITPSSTSSKILVVISHNGVRSTTGSSNGHGAIKLLRGSTLLKQLASGLGYNGANDYNGDNASMNWLDSPSTTSSTTYKTQVNAEGATMNFQHSGGVASMTLMEIKG